MNIFLLLLVLYFARNTFADETEFIYPAFAPGVDIPTFEGGQNAIFNWTTDADKLDLLLWTNKLDRPISLGKGISSSFFVWTVDYHAFFNTDPEPNSFYHLCLYFNGSTKVSARSGNFNIIQPSVRSSVSTSTPTLWTALSTFSSSSPSDTADHGPATTASGTEGLGAGVIAGIVVGTILGIGLSVCVGVLLARRRYRANKDPSDQGTSQEGSAVFPNATPTAECHSTCLQGTSGGGTLSQSPPPVELGEGRHTFKDQKLLRSGSPYELGEGIPCETDVASR
ncbi:hypothetical protein CORC01_06812 [Colletotrichum orchidophilum]|uniref:Mid2 domain-containing protein n=1 Tax=Colletotrichum orchidophilum TaxID=1209926 RepID=A0A1G4B956_9PEZI|nr:uncharacterized protein CORC01_06812 [Colletotrichum orchidophilum]OHE97949.1 hypothetical protein CORC01_06812 [Colletotrichum orchidophilum]